MSKDFSPAFTASVPKTIKALGVEPAGVNDEPNDKKIAYKETAAYDENGELIYQVTKKPGWQNGGGFVISYTEKMCEFLEKVSVGSTVRVFLYIAHHQEYGSANGVFGYRCSHKHLQQVLRLDRKSVYNALSWLKDNFLVHEGVYDGQREFMVNPNYVTIGTSKKLRLAEWSKRWEAHWKAKNRPLTTEQNASNLHDANNLTKDNDDN